MPILEVKGIKKSFGAFTAVDGISFEAFAGEVFTIIGPNGAGKTTTLEMIEGIQIPDEGEITIKGCRWKEHSGQMKQWIGVQPQSSAMFDLLTVYENLDVFSGFYKKKRSPEEVLELINLTDHRNKRMKSLSGGQKQRLAIGLAMINDPDIIFLDEPTTGLDPQARRNIWDIILKLKSLGKTIILTTHYMEEAEKLSDRVCIVHQGQIVALDTPQALIEQITSDREVDVIFQNDEIASDIYEWMKGQSQFSRTDYEKNHVTFCSAQPELVRKIGKEKQLRRPSEKDMVVLP